MEPSNPSLADRLKAASGANASSFLTPSFLAKLQDPEVKSVLLSGCGGGFDFVHTAILVSLLFSFFSF
jgi:hypothetical protein